MTRRRRAGISLLSLAAAVLALLGALAASGVIGTAGAATTWTITASAGTGGSISPSGAVTVNDGTDQAFTITPDAGYHIADVVVDGSSQGPIASYTFFAVSADGHTITASFAIDTFTLTYAAGANGTISGTTPQTVAYLGSGTQVTAVPNTGYHFASWSDGVLTAARTESSVVANLSVTASFAINQYTLTYTAGANGTISGTTPQTVAYLGSGTQVTAVPNTGYHFTSWSDGVLTAARTETSVVANVSATANFAINQYSLTYTAGPNGTISGASPQTIDYLTSGTQVTAVPNTGYHFTSWSDGVLTAARTDIAGAASLSVTANFAIDTFTITASVGANGSISPIGAVPASYGSTPSFTITAAPGYFVADVLVDGVSMGPTTRYTFPAVAADHVISASFAVGAQTTFSIGVAKSVVNYGSSTVLTGVLYSVADPLHQVGLGAQPVTVQSASSTAGPWLDLNTLTTSSVAGSVGTCAVTVTPTGPTFYRLRFLAAADSGYGSVLSYFVRVSVRPVIGTPAVPLSVRVRKSFTIAGTLRPRFPAGQKTVEVAVYRLKNRRWVLTRTLSAVDVDSGATSRYGASVKLTARGKYRVRATTAATATWAAGTTPPSRVLTVR